MDTAHEGPVEKGSPSRHGSKPGGLTASIKHDADFHLLLERGRPISIEHGASVWRAIYWGRDETGEIVAYNSDGHWRLIRVDLRSMVDELVEDDLLPLEEIHSIEKDIIETMGVENNSAPKGKTPPKEDAG